MMESNQHASLPVPDAESLARSTMLSARIATEIAAAGGWLPFSRYMELALYTPGLGYYSGANIKFGRNAADGSDFITAPEISPFFARALAQPVAEALALAETDEIMEFGAGTGQLAFDLLTALAALNADQPVDAVSRARRPATALRQVRRYTIVELSGELRERQRQTVGLLPPELRSLVYWIDRLPERFSGLVIGNEVLDAMPIRLHPYADGRWFERGVALDGTRLVWEDKATIFAGNAAPTPALRQKIEHSADQYLVETHDAAEAFVATVATMLVKGAAFFIDYGFPEHEYYHPQRAEGTLMCHYRHHAHGDPLLYPGLQDITAHVNFSVVAEAVLNAGADVMGFTSQARFLINAGIADHLSRAVDPSDTANYLPAASGVQKLLSEAEMGELFKVIGFGRGLKDVPQAFISGDRSWTLLPEDDEPLDASGSASSPDSSENTP